MKQYLDLLRHILENGERREDRTGTGTLSIFGAQIRYDLRDGFPLVTTKKVSFAAVIHELFWFLSGSTNAKELSDKTPIWDAWAREDGDLGPVYGSQFRSWGGRGIDQISNVIRSIKTDPASRRHIVSAWNVEDIPKMALAPCHALFQFYVADGAPPGHSISYRYLDCQLYQRSADLALGVPYNVASYALLTSMIAGECGLIPRHFIHTVGDAHIYLNHIEGVKLQLTREPLPLSKLVLADKPVLEQRFEDIRLEGYQHHPFIKFEVSV